MPKRAQIIHQVRLRLGDEEDRVLLELYAAQSLGLSVSHPRIRAGLAG